MPPNAGPRRRSPSQERAKATREHILDTAARLFGQRGIGDTSTNRIAAEAGVSIGTVYRYFADRSVMVEELLERLLVDIEKRLEQQLIDTADEPPLGIVTGVLETVTDELVARTPLVKALIAGIHFYNSSVPDFEPRLRSLIKQMLIRVHGVGDERKYDTMSFVVLNTCFATLLRATAMEMDPAQRRDTIGVTARMITAWLDVERDLTAA
ncbi:TetR/AcrR family transcriptional regulator [Nocardia sp. NPDC003482]